MRLIGLRCIAVVKTTIGRSIVATLIYAKLTYIRKYEQNPFSGDACGHLNCVRLLGCASPQAQWLSNGSDERCARLQQAALLHSPPPLPLTTLFTTTYALMHICFDTLAQTKHARFSTFSLFVFSTSGKILSCFYNRFYMPFRISLPKIVCLYLLIEPQQLNKMTVVLRLSLFLLIRYSLSPLSIISFHPTTTESLSFS